MHSTQYTASIETNQLSDVDDEIICTVGIQGGGRNYPPYSGLKKLDRNFVTLKFLSYEKIEKNI